MFKAENLANYEGREHAKAKHALLESYIRRYTMILGAQVPSLAFIDAFAGPWKSATDDRSDTSFGLSLNALKGCAEALRSTFHKQPKIRALWIEENQEAFATLSEIAIRSSNSRISIEAEQGRFQDKIERIVQFIGNETFAFIFVDPKGYRGLIEPKVLAPLLKLPRTELLINYMWDHIRFALGRPHELGHVENMRKLFGRHTDRLYSQTDGAQRETASLIAFENELREASGHTERGRLRVLSYPIRNTHGQQYPKYYLVPTTHSAKGLVTFTEQCDQTELIQSSIFQIATLARRERKSATTDMFSDQIQPEPSVAEPATQPWLDALKTVGDELRVDTASWAALLEAGRCLPSALQQGARTLIQEGVLENIDARRPRSKNFVKYEKSERIRRIR